MTKQTLIGPNGLRLVLDSAEIFPDDPGQGTPAMVYLRGESATYWCALNEGEVDRQATNASQQAWLEAQEDTVSAFLEDNDPA